jgi:small subunit ribosomal protein S20
MANHKSAEKRIRQTTTRTAVNRKRTSVIKSSLKKVEAAIVSGNKAAAQQALKEAQPTLMSGVIKGVVKLGTATRKMRRLSSRIKKLAA